MMPDSISQRDDFVFALGLVNLLMTVVCGFKSLIEITATTHGILPSRKTIDKDPIEI